VPRFGLEFHVCDWLGWFPKRDIGLSGIFMTRPLLEGTVRGLLARNGGVTIRDGVTVGGWKLETCRVSVRRRGRLLDLQPEWPFRRSAADSVLGREDIEI